MSKDHNMKKREGCKTFCRAMSSLAKTLLLGCLANLLMRFAVFNGRGGVCRMLCLGRSQDHARTHGYVTARLFRNRGNAFVVEFRRP